MLSKLSDSFSILVCVVRRHSERFLLLSASFCLATTVVAQSGFSDPTFNRQTGPDNNVLTSVVQTDGKILLGGQFTDYAGVLKSCITRVNSDGSLDATFNAGSGCMNTNLISPAVTAMAIQSNGKIIIGGNFSLYNNQSSTNVIRINGNGTRDFSFAPPSLSNAPEVAVVQPDGKVIMAGTFTGPYSKIIRLNSNGSADGSFNINTDFTSDSYSGIYDVVVQPDGKILVAGNIASFGSTNTNNILRLNADGTLDPTFATVNTGLIHIYDIHLLADGKIIAASENKVVRFNANGTQDASFTTVNANGIVRSLSVQPDGKLVIGGDFTTLNGQAKIRLARLNANGSIDASFTSGSGHNNLVQTSGILPDGRIIVGGKFKSYRNDNSLYFGILSPAGEPVFSGKNGEGANNTVYTACIQADQKIVIGGQFTEVDKVPAMRLARLNPDGYPDLTFSTGSGPNGFVKAICSQADSKLIIAGNFTSYNGVNRAQIARINTDGSIDLTFNPGSGLDGQSVEAIAVQADGKIIIGGNFSTYNGAPAQRIARLNTDGTLDAGFTSGSGNLFRVTRILIQPNGKILVAGEFTAETGADQAQITRLNADGTPDLTFTPGSGAGFYDIYALALQSDGKIIVGGEFDYFQGVSRNRLARLDSNGLLDPGFVPPSSIAIVNAISIQDDGKVVVGLYSSNSVNVKRLNSNGTLDNTFYSPISNTIHSLQSTSTGNIIVTGYFGTDQGTSNYARISTCLPGSSTQTETACGSFTWINGITYTQSTTAAFTTVSVGGCDSVVTLQLTVSPISNTLQEVSVTGNYTWSVTGEIYTESGIYTDTIISSANCDSIVTLILTILPPTVSTFSIPSSNDECTGAVAISALGNPDFTFDMGVGDPVTTSEYALIDSLCPGFYALTTVDGNGDTINSLVVIPGDSNFILNDPFAGLPAVDSLGITLEDCTVFYNSIDSAYIAFVSQSADTVFVTWDVIGENGISSIQTSYILGNGSGIYYVQLNIYCPEKSSAQTFTVTQSIYYNGYEVTLLDITENASPGIHIFPNPTSESVTVLLESSEAILFVYDVHGKIVTSQKLAEETKISLNDFQQGVYLFEVLTETGKTVKRVVKN